MKTLEQVIREASDPHYGVMGEKTKAIASAVREWMREQNEELRDKVHSVVDRSLNPNCFVTGYSIAKCVDAILSVIPPREQKCDALRERFPFLPGEEFWTLFQNAVCRWTVEKIWFNSDDKLCLKGYRPRSNGSLLESPTYRAGECYPTAEACRAAIQVEE